MNINWTLVKIVAGVVLIAALVSGYFYVQNVKADRDRYKTERNAARADHKQCKADQKLTSEVSHDYQTKIASLNRQLADLKRVRDNPQCVVPTAGAAGGRDDAPGAGKPAGPHGVRTEWLLDFAAEGEQYRLQLMSCQDFISRTWQRTRN